MAGGGMAGVCAALAAARHGAKVVLAQDRSRLGGNASSEVKMHVVGADCSGGRPGWREGGLIEELRLDDAAHNPQRSWELWDLLLYDKLKREPNVTLLLDSPLFAAETRDDAIQRVLVRCDKTEHLYRIRAPLYIDCTGDSRLALEAGAEQRWGREAQSEFNESLARAAADRQTLGSSLLFTARDYGRPVPFTPPPWARKVTKAQLQFRSVRSWEYGYWWIEWGGQLDTIRDNERIRFELLAIVLGVWDYIKNSGDKPDSAHWGMDWVGMIPGKRESRRVVGDHLLTQHDLEGKTPAFADAVAMGGWPLDDHPPSGFDQPEERPARQIQTAAPYNIPLRSLYSRNIRNLLMAGRNISASHVAFTSTRVMATCAVVGQAAGTAAVHAFFQGMLPDVATFTGQGRGQIREANLVKLPLFISMFRDVLSVQRIKDTYFHLVDARFGIGKGKFTALSGDAIAMESDVMTLRGFGSVDFDLNCDLFLSLPSFGLPQIPLISPFLRRIIDNIAAFHVTGPLDEPQISYVLMRDLQMLFRSEPK